MVAEGIVPVSSKLLKAADAVSDGEEGLLRWTSSLSALALVDLTSPSSFLTANNCGEKLLLNNEQ